MLKIFIYRLRLDTKCVNELCDGVIITVNIQKTFSNCTLLRRTCHAENDMYFSRISYCLAPRHGITLMTLSCNMLTVTCFTPRAFVMSFDCRFVKGVMSDFFDIYGHHNRIYLIFPSAVLSSITPSFFLSNLKTFLFLKSYPS